MLENTGYGMLRMRVAVAATGLAMAVLLALPLRADPIYKCGSDAAGVVYTDTPCADGRQLDLRPGAADPAALERLQKTRDALDRSAERRVANLDREAAQNAAAYRIIGDPFLPEPVPDDAYGFYDYGYMPAWYVPAMRNRKSRPKPPAPRFAPRPPYFVPR
jgi:hypothetical protein